MKLSTIEIAHILLWVAYKTPIWNSLLPHHIQAFQFLFLKGFSKHTSTFPQPQEEHWELLIYLIKIFAKYILYICMFFFCENHGGGLLGPHHLQVNYYRTKMTLGIKSRPAWSGPYFQRCYHKQVCLYVLKSYVETANMPSWWELRLIGLAFFYWCQLSTAYLHSSKLTVIEFGDGCSFGHIFLSALRTNSLRFQAFLSAVFCLHQICSSSITQFSPLLLFPITK